MIRNSKVVSIVTLIYGVVTYYLHMIRFSETVYTLKFEHTGLFSSLEW